MNNADKILKFNKISHDKNCQKYESVHERDIFNANEQERLGSSLIRVIGYIENQSRHTALDIGVGTGNLTDHLIKLGITVTAADVSTKFMEFVGLNTRARKNVRY